MKSKPIVSVNKVDERYTIIARALHDLRGHVNKLLESKARIGMLSEMTIIAFDEEMRRFIKQYQDRVESWPADATTGELLPHVARVTNNTEVRATPLTSNDTAPRMPRAHLMPVTDAQTVNISELPKPRIRYLRQIPYGAKKVGWMNVLSRQAVYDAVSKWESAPENEGYTLGVFKCGRIYEFYKVPKYEQH